MAKQTVRAVLNADPLGNRTQNINQINGIQGVAPGQVGVITMPTGTLEQPFRIHRSKLFCKCVNYTGGNALATVKLTGGGDNVLKVNMTIDAKRQPLALTISDGGTGYAVNDTFSVTDATGAGAVFTVTAVAAGVVTAATYNANSATATPVEPDFFFSSFQQVVAGYTPRSISPVYITMLAQAVGIFPALGELPLNYAEPSRNFLQENDVSAWDLTGAKSFNYQYKISSNVVLPTLSGSYEFDQMRNAVNIGGNVQFFNRPVKHVEQLVDLGAGTTPINNLTIFGRLLRLWIIGATPGKITMLEVQSDGQKRLEASVEEIAAMYADYGFCLGRPNWANQAILTSNTVKAALNPIKYFDACYLSDDDSRFSDGLSISGSLILKVTSSIAQKATVIIECDPNGFI